MSIKRTISLFVVAAAFSFFFAHVSMADDGATVNSQNTAKEAEVMKSVDEGKTAFVCFYKENAEGLAAIKANLNAMASNFKRTASIIYVSNDDKKEERLRANFGALSGETAVFALLPSGAIAAKLKGADITKDNLLKVLLAPKQGGCCSRGSQRKCH